MKRIADINNPTTQNVMQLILEDMRKITEAFAYTRKQKGILFVRMQPGSAMLCNDEVTYMPINDLEKDLKDARQYGDLRTGGMLQEAIQMAENYDPESQAIFAFIKPNQTIQFFKYDRNTVYDKSKSIIQL